MTLEEKINADYVTAMKARDQERSSCLSFLRAQVKNIKIDKRIENVPDEDVLSVIKKQIKQRLDSIKQFTDGGRPELAAKETLEMGILKSYLPEALPIEAVRTIIETVIKETGAVSIKDMSKVMKEVVIKVADRADNQTVGALVKEYLTKA